MKRTTKKLATVRETLLNLAFVRGGDGTSTEITSSVRPGYCDSRTCPKPN